MTAVVVVRRAALGPREGVPRHLGPLLRRRSVCRSPLPIASRPGARTIVDPIAPPTGQYPDRASAADQLCRAAADFHARGWCLGTSGNFSVLLQDRPLELLITRSGCDKRRLTPEDFVVVGRDGKPRDGESARPSQETLLHSTVATLTRAGAVLHTHSVWNTLLGEHHRGEGGLSITGYEMLKGLESIASHTAEVFVPIMANSQNIAALAEQMVEVNAEWPGAHGFLIAGHGLYTWGPTLGAAIRHVEVFEFLFECVGRKTDLVAENGRGPTQ